MKRLICPAASPSISTFSLMCLSWPERPSLLKLISTLSFCAWRHTLVASHHTPVSQNPSSHPFGRIQLMNTAASLHFGVFAPCFFAFNPRLILKAGRNTANYLANKFVLIFRGLNMWLMCIPCFLWICCQSHYCLLLSSFLLTPNGLINPVDYIGSAIIIQLPVSARCKMGSLTSKNPPPIWMGASEWR